MDRRIDDIGLWADGQTLAQEPGSTLSVAVAEQTLTVTINGPPSSVRAEIHPTASMFVKLDSCHGCWGARD